MTRTETELLKARTEAIRQFRIAFRGGDDGHAQLEGLRREIHHLNRKLEALRCP